MLYHARTKLAAEVVLINALSYLLDRNADRQSDVFIRWLLLIAGVLTGLELFRHTFPGSILAIIAITMYCARRVRNPLLRNTVDEVCWLGGGIVLGLLMTQSITVLQVLWFIGGYLLWPRIGKIKSTNLSQFFLILGVITLIFISVAADIYLKRFLPPFFGTNDAPNPAFIFGVMARAYREDMIKSQRDLFKITRPYSR